ncbi:hypothetical protein HanRHA438_Chr08g0370731 [Helianthus annuus]|nr:hypothetical protein HanRHA438_Chr08g0370731 [Helianthus annuus]
MMLMIRVFCVCVCETVDDENPVPTKSLPRRKPGADEILVDEINVRRGPFSS